MIIKNFLITGRPGIGKTTCVLRIISLLSKQGLRIGGFITREVRERGKRIGFLIQTFPEMEEVYLASTRYDNGPRIGKYIVNLDNLENVGVSSIKRALESSNIVVIDEIGPMELLSNVFKKIVLEAFNSDKPIVATIHFKARRYPFGKRLLARSDIIVYELTLDNREHIYRKITDDILDMINFKGLKRNFV
ncbi:MAG: NTPase [Thermoproteales archaeon]|nr:NTPase [Thermoproteales archaeon]